MVLGEILGQGGATLMKQSCCSYFHIIDCPFESNTDSGGFFHALKYRKK